MEDVKDMYGAMLRTSKRMEILYEAYKEQATNNDELKTLLQEEKEDKHWLQLQLRAMTKELE